MEPPEPDVSALAVTADNDRIADSVSLVRAFLFYASLITYLAGKAESEQ